MTREEIIAIAAKVAEGTASREEMALYIRHIDTFIKEYQDWELVDPLVKDKIQAQLRADIKGQILPVTVKKGIFKLWPRIAVAASVALAVAVGGYFYFNPSSKSEQSVSYVHDMSPGKVGATLTLASGRQIRLADAANGELAKEAGVVISKTADGQLIYELKGGSGEDNKVNTVATATGETYQLRLPDGTLVWLNAASSLTYSANLNDKAHLGQRRVSLSGEAYFEVAKDKLHPFLVETERQQVEVLGTHFNVSSYRDDPGTRTTLLEGLVKVNGDWFLRPGQQAGTGRAGRTTIAEVDVNEAVAWKDGKFVFEFEPIEGVMRKLARWYGAEVIYQGDFSGKTFTGSISRSDNISKILEKITYTQDVHFKIEGRRIMVMP